MAAAECTLFRKKKMSSQKCTLKNGATCTYIHYNVNNNDFTCTERWKSACWRRRSSITNILWYTFILRWMDPTIAWTEHDCYT